MPHCEAVSLCHVHGNMNLRGHRCENLTPRLPAARKTVHHGISHYGTTRTFSSIRSTIGTSQQNGLHVNRR